MDLYHASPVRGLTVLEPSVTKYFGKPRQVCLTALEPMALFYGVKHFEYTYGYTGAGALYYEEYFPGALAEIYRGRSAALYRCAWREGMEAAAIPNEYVSAEPVAVEEEIFIPDLYEALLERESRGLLRIVRWEQLGQRKRDWIRRAEAEVIREQCLLTRDSPFARYMREKYPESWALARQETEKSKEREPK